MEKMRHHTLHRSVKSLVAKKTVAGLLRSNDNTECPHGQKKLDGRFLSRGGNIVSMLWAQKNPLFLAKHQRKVGEVFQKMGVVH